MKSAYPEHVVRQVLQQLDALDALEYLDYRPESIQRDRDVVRMFCPIHGEDSYRTLTVQLEDKAYLCSRSGCPGNAGGDLIDLVARARRIQYDSALRQLVEEFALRVELPKDQQAVNRALVEAENLISLVLDDRQDSASEQVQEAHERLDWILEESPGNVQALRMRLKLVLGTGLSGEVAPLVLQIAEAEASAGNFPAVEEVLHDELTRDPANTTVRRRLAECYRDQDRSEEALEQLLMIAETAEAMGDLGVAIKAYRGIQDLGEIGFDVGPMIAQLLVASDNKEEAVSELIRQVYEYRERGNLEEAINALGTAVEIQPENAILQLQLLESQKARGIRDSEFKQALARVDAVLEQSVPREVFAVLACLMQGRPASKEVRERFRRARESMNRTPGKIDFLRRLAEDSVTKGESHAAQAIYEQLVELVPDDRRAHKHLASLAREHGEMETAAIHWRATAELAEQSGKTDSALFAWRQVAECLPADLESVTKSVEGIVRLGLRDEALGVLRASIEEAPSGVSAGLIERALELAPDDPELVLEYARLREQAGDRVRSSTEYVRAADLLLREGRFSRAEKALQPVLGEECDANGDALRLMGEIAAARGKDDEAAGHFRQAARSFQKKEEIEAARAVARRCLDVDPDSLATLQLARAVLSPEKDKNRLADVHIGLMRIHRGKDQFAEAIREAHEVLDILPDHLEAHRALMELYRLAGDSTNWGRVGRGLAAIYRQKGDLESEETLLLDLIARRPRDLAAHERLLEVRHIRGEGPRSEATISNYVERAEQLGEIRRCIQFLSRLVEEHSETEALRRALVDLQRKRETTYDHVTHITFLIDKCEEAGDLEEAIRWCGELLHLSPADSKLRERHLALLLENHDFEHAAVSAAEYGQVLFNEDDFRGAAQRFHEALSYHADCEAAYRGLVQLALARADNEGAINALRQLAERRAARRNVAGALEALDEALRLDGTHPRVLSQKAELHIAQGGEGHAAGMKLLTRLAEAFALRGQTEERIGAMRRAIELDPADAKRRRVLVDCLLSEGQSEAAIRELLGFSDFRARQGDEESAAALCEEALHINPNHIRARSRLARLCEKMGKRTRALEEWKHIEPLLDEVDFLAVDRDIVPGEDLRSDWTFESFRMDKGNRVAREAALAVAGAPGNPALNPLLIIGEDGLGKTHLLHAVGNAVRRDFPEKTVILVNAREFASEVVASIRNGRFGIMRERYDSADLLMIDDLQLLEGKKEASDEFLYQLEVMAGSGRQVIANMNEKPVSLPDLDARLLARLRSCTQVWLDPPGEEVRLEILQARAAEWSTTPIPVDTLKYLATSVTRSVRDLETALKQLLVMHSVGRAPLTPETARTASERFAGASSPKSSES